MNCVITACENEAKRGFFHCTEHDPAMKQPMILDSQIAQDILTCAKRTLGTWSKTPPISQRTLVTAIQQHLETRNAFIKPLRYDEVAAVLRQAVDSGDLVSYEKNDTTFYELPPEAPAAPERPAPRNHLDEVMDDVYQVAAGPTVVEIRKTSDVAKLAVLEPPGPVLSEAMLVSLGLDFKARALILEMLDTGLYGNGYDQFVREAICAHVREYVKGKK